MTDLVLNLAAALYVGAALLLTLFVGSFGVLLAVWARTRGQSVPLPRVSDAALPHVTVQLPIYNEAHVALRALDACARLDYPAEKLTIQVLDDSTDATAAQLARAVSAWRARGVDVALLRRSSRAGYKAGALAHGLAHVTGALVAVFDADFVPPPDFLRRTAPHFLADPRLALVQTRWEHLNADENGLTRAQALALDAHFAVEQLARQRGGFPFSMNGTGALWRVSALRDAGGWSAATLTEDLDLSYRALLRGWRFLYLPQVAAAGEIPPLLQAYKVQQRRWAEGMTQNLLRHALPLLRSQRYGWGAKWMGLAHLASYAVQPLMLLLFLLTPLLLWGGAWARLPNLSALGAVGIVPPALMVAGQLALRRPWWRTLRWLPLQGLLGAGMMLNNTAGALVALRPGRARTFHRTPKFAQATRSPYTPTADALTWGELLLGGYALWGAALAWGRAPALLPYLLSQALAFWGVALVNLAQLWGRCSQTPARGETPLDPASRRGTRREASRRRAFLLGRRLLRAGVAWPLAARRAQRGLRGVQGRAAPAGGAGAKPPHHPPHTLSAKAAATPPPAPASSALPAAARRKARGSATR